MIQFKQLTLTRGTKILIQGATMQLHPGHKVGLTGANGTGKSSLFAMLRGELHAENGDFEMPASWVVAHVAQETPALAVPAIEFVLDGDAELREIETALAKAEANHQGELIAELHQRLSDVDGYSAKARASELLNGLGFSQASMQQPVATFSGGWRVRLNLARALMCRSDLLLLDEPTNHLDLDAVIWLESWLQTYRGTLFLISHDRDFLDAIVNHIAHIEQQTLTLYRGGYSDFERQRAEKLALQQAMFEKQQRKVAHLQSYIDRFRVQATKARQAQSRIKALERMEMISAAHVDSQFSFEFRAPVSAPDPLLVLDNMSVGYASQPLISNIELAIRPGERIGLLGKNGAGKTTLIKLLAHELAPLSGKRVEGKDLKIGYFAQHQLEQLRPDESPLQHMVKLDPLTREQEHLNYLGGFDFRGEMALSPCANFSGGEKSRLALALLIWTRPNLLLLDEPTNHLDLEMRHALTLALQDFEGGVILVSHDRALLRATCDQFLLVADGKAADFDGDLEDYSQWLNAQRLKEKQATQSLQVEKTGKNDRAQTKAERQARIAERRPLLKELEQIERNMAQMQADKKVCDDRLNDTALYAASDKTELQQLLKTQAELSTKLESAEERWLELHEMLEALPVID
ncbi:MAG: ABC transporter ATP-binding protein [Methylotenera sp. 24-45-7]|nr:MAG: ABC transporter ATP-binding protein [Mehylophilales bacterium 35-46-6]OYZ41408.1 MAG: ABC transporter ATP-binding protein [Methylotenera sp. 24-45-7]OZA08761.1 MAG: ABC transporter ATP-binding protein [Methylotenera sp. 17-45-7]OZA54110.1 MAG: ABC transporter ATP-binding protein [Methylophilales bacterium 39-45-7]HQS36726.1 ATP-binding cassette domain-containing protein [Methylotenera sp.]